MSLKQVLDLTSSLFSLSSSDINECRQRVCRSDQQCKNTRGGYTCIDLCPNGMTKGANGTCVGEYSQYFLLIQRAITEVQIKKKKNELGDILHCDYIFHGMCPSCRHRWVQRWNSSMPIQSDLWEYQRQLPLHLSTWLQISGVGTSLCRYVHPSYPVISTGKTLLKMKHNPVHY